MNEQTEARSVFLREQDGFVELCIRPSNEPDLMIYVLRPAQLTNIAIDATRLALRQRDRTRE